MHVSLYTSGYYNIEKLFVILNILKLLYKTFTY